MRDEYYRKRIRKSLMDRQLFYGACGGGNVNNCSMRVVISQPDYNVSLAAKYTRSRPHANDSGHRFCSRNTVNFASFP